MDDVIAVAGKNDVRLIQGRQDVDVLGQTIAGRVHQTGVGHLAGIGNRHVLEFTLVDRGERLAMTAGPGDGDRHVKLSGSRSRVDDVKRVLLDDRVSRKRPVPVAKVGAATDSHALRYP